jgi:hypothetical protein
VEKDKIKMMDDKGERKIKYANGGRRADKGNMR